MTHDEMSIESVLAIDCGSTTTQALLVDRVGHEYRLIARAEAPSSKEPPWNDIVVAVRQAVSKLTEITGWRLLDEAGQIITPERQDGGVDAVVAVASASEPLRTLAIGLRRDISLESARQALAGSYVLLEEQVSLDRRQGGVLSDDVDGQIRLIRELKPDLVVLVGGIDGADNDHLLVAAEAVGLGCSALPKGERPTVVYAGNADLRPAVAEILGAYCDLRAVDNVRPELSVENPAPLQTEVEEIYHRKKMDRVPGFGTLAAWSPVPVQPANKAFAQTVQYLAQLDGINVLGVNVGGASTTAASVVDRQLDLRVRSDLGLSYSAARLLEEVPVESILRWLPFEMDPGDLRDAMLNKALRPRTLPQTRQELLLEQALAREILRLTVADLSARWPQGGSRLYKHLLPKFHLIVGAGGVLANVASFGQAALMLLDGLQPVGVCGLALDRVGLTAPLSAVAMVNPLAAAQVMEQDALLNLGTVVAPVGTAREGETALTFRLNYEDERTLEVEVAYGSLEIIPLPAGRTATLELRPSRRFDIGLGTKGQAGTTKVEGGIIGIIVDARGRPLPMAEDAAEQQARMQRWLWDMGS